MMTSILNEFKVFDEFRHKITQNIKLFHVIGSKFAICVTNDDKVYAFDDKLKFNYFEKEKDNFKIIPELCDQNIEQFFCCHLKCLFTRSTDNKIFGTGHHQGEPEDEPLEYLKPKRIEFFDDRNIIDISCGSEHWLALSTEGHVYGAGDNIQEHFDKSGEPDKFLTPVLINSVFGVKEKVKHIHCCNKVSVLVTFDGFVYILNPENDFSDHFMKISQLSEVNKIYINYNFSAFVLKDNGVIECISIHHRTKSFNLSVESVLDCQYFSNEQGHCETVLIIPKDKGVQIVYAFGGKVSVFKDKNLFEYCLLKYGTTFGTINLKENGIHYKDFELNGKTKTLVQSSKRIDFNYEEYCDKYHNSNDSQSLKNFRESKCLPEIYESKVKFYHQIGRISNFSSFFVMDNNKVYAIGTNFGGILGLGHERDVNGYTIIEELCDQNIIEFFEGSHCMFGRTDRNQIFSWGYICCCQLGRPNLGVFELSSRPMMIDFEDIQIIDIRCGSTHCLALSKEGLVYGWGCNSYGQTGSRSDKLRELTPIEVELNNPSDRIKFIHCSGDTSCAVTVDGRAYLWGKINERETVIPILIETNVKKIHLKSEFVISILKTDEVYEQKRFVEFLNTETLLEIKGVTDIYGPSLIMKEHNVYEFNENSGKLRKTILSTFYEYFWYTNKCFDETIHISSDGYIMRQTIQLNENNDQKLLEKTFVNIFDQKYQNTFVEQKLLDKGEGNFGKVFRAKHKTTREWYAIKRIEIKGDLMETLKEIKIMTQLNSEYVVKYYNSWTEAQVLFNNIENYVFIQMELCSQNLESFIKLINELRDIFDQKFKRIEYFIRSEIVVDIIKGLNCLHSINPPIIHRDLKPANILITENGIIKLGDFGLSKVSDRFQSKDVGSAHYRAPEVYTEYKPEMISYNERSDIYSLGVVATDIFNFEKPTKKAIKNRKKKADPQFQQYMKDYMNTDFESEARVLLSNILQMLSWIWKDRPTCSQLLDKTHEWTVDTKTIRSDEYYEEFVAFSENDENLKVLKSYFDFKTNVDLKERSNELKNISENFSSLRISN